MPENGSTVGELLEQSRAAHVEYRSHLPRSASVNGAAQAVGGDVVKAAEALDRAATLRKSAHDADPGQADRAWLLDAVKTGGPDALMTWYAEQLARDDDPVAVAARAIADSRKGGS